METVRVAICDDEILLLPQLSSMIKGLFCTYNLEVSLDTFSTAAGLLEKVYGSQPYDVYFLDIDIPEQDGIMLAEKIRMRQPEAVFLFVSAREERVYDTFQVQPIAFVRKSHFSKDIKKAMEILMKKLKKPEDTVIVFRDELGHGLRLNLTKMIYAEAQEKYQNIVSVDGQQLIRCSISDLEEALTSYGFIRIHRGYLVNCAFIYRIDAGEVVLDGGQKLPLSRHRKKEVQKQFLEYAYQERKG